MNHEYVFFNCEIATFLQYKNIIELFKSIIEKELIQISITNTKKSRWSCNEFCYKIPVTIEIVSTNNMIVETSNVNTHGKTINNKIFLKTEDETLLLKIDSSSFKIIFDKKDLPKEFISNIINSLKTNLIKFNYSFLIKENELKYKSKLLIQRRHKSNKNIRKSMKEIISFIMKVENMEIDNDKFI